MAKVNYGTTWWGRRWLEALSAIDHENKIPRGKTYANTGRVLDIEKDPARHTISSKVEGHYSPFYHVKLTLTPFTDEEKERIMAAIMSSPLLLAKLAARDLAPELEDELGKLGISIFPKKWSELRMRCDCPDTAVPCKHISALIYMMSKDIDADPFIIFRLRGLDLIADLEKNGVEFRQVGNTVFPNLSELSLSRPDYPVKKLGLETLRKISFARIPNMLSTITSLIAPSPAGWTGGPLRDLIVKVVTRAGRIFEKDLNSERRRTVPLQHMGGETYLAFPSSYRGLPKLGRSISWREEDPAGSDSFIDCRVADGDRSSGSRQLHELFAGKFSKSELERAPLVVEALYEIWVTAGRLLKAGAVMPQLFDSGDGYLVCQWLPAVVSKEVRDLTIEAGSALLSLPAGSITVYGRVQKNPLFLGEMVLAAFIEDAIVDAYYAINTSEEELEKELLFSGTPVRSQDNRHRLMRQSLAGWLAPLTMTSMKEQPVLRITDLRTKEEKSAAEKGRSISPDTESSTGLELGFDVANKTGSKKTAVSLHEIFTEPRYTSMRFECLQISARLAAICPDLEKLLDTASETADPIPVANITSLVLRSVPALEFLGVRIVMPKGLSKLLSPHSSVSMGLSSPWKESGGILALGNLLTSSWEIAVGEKKITREDFDRLRGYTGQIIRFGDTFIYVDPAEIEQIEKRLKQQKSGDAQPRGLIAAAFSGEYDGSSVSLSPSLKKALARLTGEQELELPKMLTADLRPYQVKGYSWLSKNIDFGMGSIIADDMGLGKTVQVIAAIERLRERGDFASKFALIAVPATLITNWTRELRRFAPEIRFFVYYGTKKTLPAAENGAEKPDVILTSYGVARTACRELGKLPLRLLIIDEAQAISNPQSQLFKAVSRLQSDARIAMSGTPVENRLMEYWSIMQFANPGLLGPASRFAKDFERPIEERHDPDALARFSLITAPFILRHRKTDTSIITELPEKLVFNRYCTLTGEQAALYQGTVDDALSQIAAEAENSEDGRNAEEITAERGIAVQKLIIRLKQICDAPELLPATDRFQGPEYSGKGEAMLDLVSNVIDTAGKVLIFTQFPPMGPVLQNWISARTGRIPDFISDETPDSQRQAMIDRFQNDRSVNIMILSIRTPGKGISLTAANTVIHYDLWWNPSVENPGGADRAFRIGQNRDVSVFRFITADTFEEKVDDIVKKKPELSVLSADECRKYLGAISDDELHSIFDYSKNSGS